MIFFLFQNIFTSGDAAINSLRLDLHGKTFFHLGPKRDTDLFFQFKEGIYNQSGMFLLFLSFPIAIKLMIDIHQTSGKELNFILSRTALLIRLFSILLIIGILL